MKIDHKNEDKILVWWLMSEIDNDNEGDSIIILKDW